MAASIIKCTVGENWDATERTVPVPRVGRTICPAPTSKLAAWATSISIRPLLTRHIPRADTREFTPSETDTGVSRTLPHLSRRIVAGIGDGVAPGLARRSGCTPWQPFLCRFCGRRCLALWPDRHDQQAHGNSYRHFDKAVQRGNPSGPLVRCQYHNREGGARKAIRGSIPIGGPKVGSGTRLRTRAQHPLCGPPL